MARAAGRENAPGKVAGFPASGKIATGRSTGVFGADITNVVHSSVGVQIAKPLTASAVVPQRLVVPAATSTKREVFQAPFRGDEQNAQRVSEYAEDIFSHLFLEEGTHMPRADYMDSQQDVNARMRGILVDWLIEVHMKYKLRSETLFLAINIVDRYLSVRPVQRKQLQLVGIVALFIAAKFEEIRPPKAAEFAHITDNTYTKKDILRMECTMLAALDFEIVVPTAAHFVERLQRVNGCEGRHRSLVEYILELALVEYGMIRYQPSLLVASALLVANEVLGQTPTWSASMAQHARRSESELRDCAAAMRELLAAAPTSSLQAVRRKYQQEKLHFVASLPCPRLSR